MSSPKVSVIMAFYNEERYISKAIDSVFNQTYKNIELILINDGSSDSSDEIVKGYNDNRIRYIKYFPNKRQGYARNRGLELATGEYVMFFDADDILLPNNIEKKLLFLTANKDIMLVSNGYYYMDKEDNQVDDPVLPSYLSSIDIKAEMPFENSIAFAGGGMIRKKIIDDNMIRFREDMIASEDYYFWMDVINWGEVANLIDPLFYYRVGYGSHNEMNQNRNQEEHTMLLENIHKKGWNYWNIELSEEQHIFLNSYIYPRKMMLSIKKLIYGLSVYGSIKAQVHNKKIMNGECLQKRYLMKLFDVTVIGRSVMVIYRRIRKKWLIQRLRKTL